MRYLKKIYIKFRNNYNCYKQRRKLVHKDFTIISNNCWGGFVYQMFGLKYTSPTIGLFIMESDYIKFCRDIKYYMKQKLEFIEPEESKYANCTYKTDITYPVAKLDDIEIYFMHYQSKEEARSKWERRKKRINYDRMLIKMSQRNDCSDNEIKEFCQLKAKNKICFTEKKYDFDCCVYVPELKELNIKGGDETKYTLEQINIYNLLNSL